MKTAIKYLSTVIGCLVCMIVNGQSNNPNLIIITTDGLRWQEIYSGVNKNILDYNHIPDTLSIIPRETLMPFVWNTFTRYGSLYGNRAYENFVNTRNYHRFSYPGYCEIFCGIFDPDVNNNGKHYNKNVSILEDLNQYESYKNRIAVFSSWEVFPYILNEPRSGLMINAGWEPIISGLITPVISRLNADLINPPSNKGETRTDDLTWRMAVEYAKVNHPKILYVSLNDTDDFGHKGDYPSYLKAINQFDTYLSEIWSLIQSDPFYKNNTYLLVTTDHGRGSTSTSWKNHGFLPFRSGETWYMEYGPGIKAKGEVKEQMQQFQVSLTYKMADFLNYKFEPHQLPIQEGPGTEVLLAVSKGK